MKVQLSEKKRIEGDISLLRLIFFLLMLMLAVALKIAGIEHPLPLWFGWLFWSTMVLMAVLVATVRRLAKQLDRDQRSAQEQPSHPSPT